MPLARVQVRNEYGLGRPELYKATNREDPKAVLDGVVVAGLVGILRQLGDLADFAAEVFHGLQEQVLITSSRSHKLMLRAHNIETSLPPLEKAMLAQTSHIHFAYTAGCEWHSRAKTEQNHFIYKDLPQFIMDSYEECRDPPRLHLLDKFDPGGPGSCLGRYSDPTFFKRESADSDEAHIEKTERSRKTGRSKKKCLSQRNGEILQGEQMHSNGGRRTSSSQSTDVVLESDLEDHSYSVDSRADVGQRKSFSRRKGETLQGEQMHSSDGRQTSCSRTADVVLESDLEDHSHSVDSRAHVGQRKSSSRRNGETLQSEQMHSDDGRQTSSSQTADVVLGSDLEDHSYSVDSRADVGQRKSSSRGNGETLQGEQMHSNDGRQTSSSQKADVVLESDLEDHSYSVDSRADIEQRKHSSRRNEETLQGEQMHSNDDRMQFASDVNGQTSSLQTVDVVPESDLDDHSYSVDLRADAGYIECVFQPSNSAQIDEWESKESPPRLTQKTDALQSAFPTIDYNFSQGSFDKKIASTSTGLTWDEKEEIVDSESQWRDKDEIPEVLDETQNLYMHENEPVASENSDFSCGEERNLKPVSSMVQTDETDSEPDNYLDALNTIESESENDLDCESKREAEQFTSHVSSEAMGNGVGATSIVPDHDFYNVFSHSVSSVSLNKETGLDFPETLQEIPPHISDGQATGLRNLVPSDVPDKIEMTNVSASSYDSGSPIHEPIPDICGNSVLDCSGGSNRFDDACFFNDTVPTSIKTVPSNAPVYIESKRKSIDSRGSESPTHEQDSYGSESPIHEQEPYQPANYVLDFSKGTNPLDDVHILDNAVSMSIEPVQSNVIVNREVTESLGDASEYHIGEQMPHTCGNSVFENAHNDSLSASSENVRPDDFVNSETAEHLADSHAHQSPIHGQVSHVCGNSVLERSVGTNPSDDYPTLNDSVPVSVEFDPSNDPVNFERTINLADSQGSVSATPEQLPHISGNSAFNFLGGGTDPLGDDGTLHDAVSASIETDISSGSRSSDLPYKEYSIDSNVCKSKETPSEPANDPSLGLWTNGGLLGLEPSKPPDFVMSTRSLNQELMTSTNDTDGVSNHNSMRKSKGYREEQDLSKTAELNQKEQSSRCLVSQCDDQACISGKTPNSHWQSSRHGQNDEDFDQNRVPTPGTVVPVAHTGCTEPSKGSELNSPLPFGLGHRLLINSFCRKVSFDEKSGPDNSVKTGLLEQSGQNSTVQQSLTETTFKERVTYDYPICSPPPSPPLEHMKISFYPVDGFETFKLKLEFPDVSNHGDSTKDVFPSFWLVPEHSILVHDSGSYSDDADTFCRSSPFVSDDCLSPHSDYNSDQWESDDTPDISGDGVNDSSQRVTLIEPKSSSQGGRGVTNFDINLDSELVMLTQDSSEHSLSGHVLDFHCFDTMNPVLGKELNDHSDYDNNLKLQGHADSVPPAPPLPTNQWWLSNQVSDMVNEKQNFMSKDTQQINDLNISESTLQVRPVLVEKYPTDHEDLEFNDDIPRKLRDKSFNQKHAVPGKPNDITSPATTDKVAAILEKANAIRQVISSDDGGDSDSWSGI